MKRFGAFEGVFTPSLLGIFGVIMYLRLGWAVGNVGLFGALVIIGIANIITLLTSLSMSSIITNIKIGAGGAYDIISKSLGLEAGGAIGLPLYLSQAISIAFYITGFTELWTIIFPAHSFLAVAISAWIAMLVVSYTSAKLAFKLQYIVMAVIALSLVSAFLGRGVLGQTPWMHGLGEVPFWAVFAVFFPAVTGVLAGASMSGELKKPGRDIILGTLSAIGVSFVVYVLLAFWFARNASPEMLVSNTSIIIELARWRWLVIAGIMGATLSSALSMFVASPRTLFALGKYKIIPFSSIFSKVNKKEEPTNAILFTAALALITLLLGSLNTIAGMLTMFFLITYGMINLSVLIEQGIGITSFRPTFKVPLVFPFLGTLGCAWAMFLINPLFSVIVIVIIVLVYTMLMKKGKDMRKKLPDVRRGLFVFLAERAINMASKLPYYPKIWKPSILVPVENPKDWQNLHAFFEALVSPSGRIYLFRAVESQSHENTKKKKQEQVHRTKLTKLKKKCEEELEIIAGPLKKSGILVSCTVVEAPTFLTGMSIATQTLKGTALPPNVLFVKLGSTGKKDRHVRKIIEKAKKEGLGIIIIHLHPANFGHEKVINLWIRRKSFNVDLAALVALQLEKNWNGKIRLISVAKNGDTKDSGRLYLARLKKRMRLPQNTEVKVLSGSFEEALPKAPAADINIFGTAQKMDFGKMRRVSEKINTPVLFLRDSEQEQESATA